MLDLNDGLSQPNCHLDYIDGHNPVAENHTGVVDKVEEGLVVLLLDVQGAHDQLSQAVQGLKLSVLTRRLSGNYRISLALTNKSCKGWHLLWIFSSKIYVGFLEM